MPRHTFGVLFFWWSAYLLVICSCYLQGLLSGRSIVVGLTESVVVVWKEYCGGFDGVSGCGFLMRA